LPIARAVAEAAADAALRERSVALGPEWRRASVVRLASEEPGPWQGHKFVWREAGREAYATLVGTTLAPPLWDVRYARFDGEVADRAEEWRVTINGDATVRQIRHVLPEGRSGAKLGRDAAQTLAERAVRERFGADPVALKLIGAEEKQRPDRTDWAFTSRSARGSRPCGRGADPDHARRRRGGRVRPVRPCAGSMATCGARARRARDHR
jgi:hypothetical protein